MRCDGARDCCCQRIEGCWRHRGCMRVVSEFLLKLCSTLIYALNEGSSSSVQLPMKAAQDHVLAPFSQGIQRSSIAASSACPNVDFTALSACSQVVSLSAHMRCSLASG